MISNKDKLYLKVADAKERTILKEKVISNWLSSCPNENVRKAQINDLKDDFKSLNDDNLFKKGKYFILKDSKEEINGSICLEFNENEKEAELKCFYVNPEYRGQGYGRLLMDELIYEAKFQEIVKINLVTISYLEVAAKFYSKYGFKNVKSFTTYAFNGAWILDKNLLNKEDNYDEYEVIFYELIL